MNTSASMALKNYDIRTMTEADLPSACALWSTAEGVSMAEGDSLSELRAYLERNQGSSHVAYSGHSLVGAVLAGHDGRRGLLYHLAVDPNHRGQGLGKELVEKSLAALRQRGIRRVLILVARDNAPGRTFWVRCGWEGMEFAEPMGVDL